MLYDSKIDNGVSFARNQTSPVNSISYGSAQVKGYVASDTVCLSAANNAQCLKQYNLLVGTSQTGLPNSIGIIGMSTGA
jgi:hypothetical protein